MKYNISGHCTISERIKFNAYIKTVLRKAKKDNLVVFLVHLDLVGFSFINYTYGYDIGDKVLLNVFLRISRVIESTDVVRNYYSDDFFILLINKDPEKNYEKLNLIKDALKKPIKIQNIEIKVEPRICIIIFPDDISDEKDALDQIFMFSKLVKSERGTGTFFFKDYSVKMLNNIGEVIKALKKISLQTDFLVPAFQNIYNLRERSIYGCEVLARIKYNDKIYSAYQFIDIVEHFNFLNKLEEILFEKALQYKLQKNDKRIYFLNISPLTMEKSLKNLNNLIQKYTKKGIDPSQICIELTESFEIKDPYRVNLLIEEYKKKLNIKFALDDFGVGYSNVAVFTQLKLDILKIDRALTDQMTFNPKVIYLMKSFYDLSLLGNIMLLAEGIEKEEQVQLLNKLNYDLVQGFFFHEPEVPKEFLDQTKE